jgi:Z1 domain
MEAAEPALVPTGLTRLAENDPFVRQIVSAWRSGAGCSLDAAVEQVKELVSVLGDAEAQRRRVDEAADRIRELARLTSELTDPKGLIVSGRPSWYPGPREDDRHWPRLRGLIERDGWDEAALRSLDRASTKVVAHLANPHEDQFARKGLVLGYVQSGKTTNYTAAIAKAADAGYAFFIVLSGIHNALRQQTQDRLDQQLFDESRPDWHRLTADHDFRPPPSVDALLTPSDKKVLAVVKKNGARLRALKDWLQSAHPDTLAACPVLIIDDEADQASINTAKGDSSPTTINGLIRQILALLPKASYVGYTATPFANVLIDPSSPDDLYPRDFIIDLPRPQDYVGPEILFGREPLEFDDSGEQPTEGHDMIREVPADEVGLLKPKSAAERESFEPEVAESLAAAVRYFLLSTAARRARGQGNRHATMLVHTSQYTLVHRLLRTAIQGYVVALAERFAAAGDLLDSLRVEWEAECERVPAAEFGQDPVPWSSVVAELPSVFTALRVIEDNSLSEDRLHYSQPDRVVIAVGGNTLSRGLTLEGLSVSYFIRSASAYDTLLQMGRWFGYRRGYADLTRIWMTDEMRGWFRHLATVEQEIRYDIERYEAEHKTPEQLAVRLRNHPQLAVTAAAKMQNSIRAQVSYSGRRLQTILFEHRDAAWLNHNLEAGRDMISAVRAEREAHPSRPGTTLFPAVDTSHVLEFLASYRFHPNSRDLNADAIQAYIRRRMEEGELEQFSVAIRALPGENPTLGSVDFGLETSIPCINRARLAHVDRQYADIKALMSRSDRVLDLVLSPAEVKAMEALELEHARDLPPLGKGDGSGLLVLYPISKNSFPQRGRQRLSLEAVEHVLGVGIVFPTSEAEASSVEYVTADLSSEEREEPSEEDELDEDVEPFES